MADKPGDKNQEMPELPPALFSDDEAETLVGKTVLVGITVLSADNEVTERRQFSGRIESVDPESGVHVRRRDTDQLEWLPPDPRAYEPAAPGEYHLTGSGEVVVDPDLVAIWTVYAAPPE